MPSSARLRPGKRCGSKFRPRDPPTLAVRASEGFSPPKRGARRRIAGEGDRSAKLGGGGGLGLNATPIVLATHARPSYAIAIRKIVLRSRIASRLRRRWDRLSAQSCSDNKRKSCSPDKQSAIRERSTSFNADPGFHFVHPGYEEREAERRRRSSPSSAPYGRGSREASRARLPASHHGACCSDRTPQLNSSDALPGTDDAEAGVTRSLPPQCSELPRRPVVMPAGRPCRSRPGAEVTSPCPREPLSLRQPVSPADVLYGSEIDRLQPAAAMIVKQAARSGCGRSPQVVG
jgi:hypothetical protein